MARPVVDLPQPDSPTRPRVSPRRTVKSIPSTALTWPTSRCKMMPSVIGKYIFRPATRTRVSSPRVSPTVSVPAALLWAGGAAPGAPRPVVDSLAGMAGHRPFDIRPTGRGMLAVDRAQQGALLQADGHME